MGAACAGRRKPEGGSARAGGRRDARPRALAARPPAAARAAAAAAAGPQRAGGPRARHGRAAAPRRAGRARLRAARAHGRARRGPVRRLRELLRRPGARGRAGAAAGPPGARLRRGPRAGGRAQRRAAAAARAAAGGRGAAAGRGPAAPRARAALPRPLPAHRQAGRRRALPRAAARRPARGAGPQAAGGPARAGDERGAAGPAVRVVLPGLPLPRAPHLALALRSAAEDQRVGGCAPGQGLDGHEAARGPLPEVLLLLPLRQPRRPSGGAVRGSDPGHLQRHPGDREGGAARRGRAAEQRVGRRVLLHQPHEAGPEGRGAGHLPHQAGGEGAAEGVPAAGRLLQPLAHPRLHQVAAGAAGRARQGPGRRRRALLGRGAAGAAGAGRGAAARNPAPPPGQRRLGAVGGAGAGAAGAPAAALRLVPVRREAPRLRPQPRGQLPPAERRRALAPQLDGGHQRPGPGGLLRPHGQLPLLPGGDGRQQHGLPGRQDHQGVRAGAGAGGPVPEAQQALGDGDGDRDGGSWTRPSRLHKTPHPPPAGFSRAREVPLLRASRGDTDVAVKDRCVAEHGASLRARPPRPRPRVRGV